MNNIKKAERVTCVCPTPLQERLAWQEGAGKGLIPQYEPRYKRIIKKTKENNEFLHKETDNDKV